MPFYEVAVQEVSRLVNGPRGPGGVFQPAFEQQIIENYYHPMFVCAPLGAVRGMARTINKECIRLLAGRRFASRYRMIEIPSANILGQAITQEPVSLEALLRIDDAISAICAHGKREIRDGLRERFPDGALPNGSIRLVGL
jgi:hypothetical protein